MNLNAYFKSVLEMDRAAVVICNLNHEILYMNPAARNQYHKYGGGELVGKSLLNCHNSQSVAMIEKALEWFQADPTHNLLYTFHNEKQNKDNYMVALREDDGKLIGYYEKHEYRNPETMERYAFTDSSM